MERKREKATSAPPSPSGSIWFLREIHEWERKEKKTEINNSAVTHATVCLSELFIHFTVIFRNLLGVYSSYVRNIVTDYDWLRDVWRQLLNYIPMYFRGGEAEISSSRQMLNIQSFRLWKWKWKVERKFPFSIAIVSLLEITRIRRELKRTFRHFRKIDGVTREI